MATRHSAYIQVVPYMEGWCLQGRIDIEEGIYQLSTTDSLMCYLLDITKEAYLKIIVDGGATLGPWNDVTYFPTEEQALATAPIVYSMIDFDYGDTIINDTNF